MCPYCYVQAEGVGIVIVQLQIGSNDCVDCYIFFGGKGLIITTVWQTKSMTGAALSRLKQVDGRGRGESGLTSSLSTNLMCAHKVHILAHQARFFSTLALAALLNFREGSLQS